MSSPLRAAEPAFGTQAPTPHGLALALVPLALSAWKFAGITQNYFLADDFVNLFDLVNDGWWHFVWQVSYGHLLPVRNAVFALHHALFGLDPAGYFATVLFNHLVNVVLLFVLIRRWTGNSEVACAAATFWGTTPTSEATLGWYSVYGHVIATTAMLVLLLSLPVLTSRGESLPPSRVAVWTMLLLGGAASFGTGLGVAAVFPLVALLVCPMASRRPAGPLTLVAITLGVGLVYLAVRATADPSLGGERYGPRLLPAGVPDLLGRVVLTFQFLAAGLATLLLGDLHTLTLRPSPFEYVAAAMLAAATAWVLAWGRGAQRRRLLAVILVTLSCYGAIAIGRSHIAEMLGLSTSIFRPVARYHYMALAALALWIGLLTAALWGASWTRRWGLAALVFANFAVSWAAGSPIDHHQGVRVATDNVVERLTQKITAQPPGATLCLPNRPFSPVSYLSGFPGEAGVFLLFLDDRAAIRDRSVFFTERNPTRRVERWPGSRLERLLVTPGRCRL
jgi:hypothetical protein